MARIATTSPDNPDFARRVAVGTLGARDFTFELSPDEGEAAALARLLGARSVRKMRFAGTLRPEGLGWALEAELGATVVQTCVVTLEPVSSRVDVPVKRHFVPESEMPGSGAGGREIEISADDEDDDFEPLGDWIDLGLVATEALALALPAYPRREGAALPDAAAETGTEEPAAPKPFAALAPLRDRLKRRP